MGTTDKGIKGIAYQNLVPLLIEAFKEQNAAIDSLKNQIKECCSANQRTNFIHAPGNITPSTENARLDQNKPNPFNTSTIISFYIPNDAQSKLLMIFDMQGELIKEFKLTDKGESFINITGNEY